MLRLRFVVVRESTTGKSNRVCMCSAMLATMCRGEKIDSNDSNK